MGITDIKGVVRGPDGKEETVRFLVDSGATYSSPPKPVWESIGLVRKREETFTLADGTAIEREVSEFYLSIPQVEAHTPVILGEQSDKALLGVVTLEILGLVLNPFNRTLQPIKMRLA